MKMVGGSWTASCYWALCILSFLVVGVSTECSWVKMENVANDPDEAIQGLPDIDNLADCRAWCENPANVCVGVQLQPNSYPICLRFATQPTLTSGAFNNYEYYNYSCTTDPTTTTEPPTSTATSATSSATSATSATSAASCKMQQVSNKKVTSSTPVSADVMADSDFCKTLCKWTRECTAATYEESTSTCTIHTSSITTSNADGNKLYQKSNCPDGKACCFEAEVESSGTSTSSYSLDLSEKLQSCKTACEEATACMALTFTGVRCSLYNATFESRDESESVYYSKSCTGGELTLASECDSHGIQLHLSKLLGFLLVAIYSALL